MKKLSLTCCSFLFTILFTMTVALSQLPDNSKFQVYQVDKDADISSLDAPKHYLKDIKKVKEIPTAQRDSILIKYLGKKLESYDELDRDLIMKSSIHYDKKQFSKKYPKLEKSYDEISKAFKGLQQ